MHRRKGQQAPEENGIRHLPSSPSASPQVKRRVGNHRGSNASASGGGAGLACVLVVLFAALLLVEFAAYRMLGASTPGDAARGRSDGVPSPPRQKRALGSAGTVARDASDNGNIPSPPKKTAASPTRQPSTYEPTDGKRAWRLKSARIESVGNSAFWKDHAPDPVPPLPPDADPETGEELPPVIAYVTTLTKCGPKHRGGLDGAAVLLHSIRRNSHGWVPMQDQIDGAGISTEEADRPQYGGRGGRYRHRAYVIVDPAASPNKRGKQGECARFLQKIGYTVLHRPPLVPLFEVEDREGGNDFYREFINQGYVGSQRDPKWLRPGENPGKVRWFMHNDGCCGYTELLKLHVYGMVEHQIAVHLDFDSLLLRPMDDLFDAMLAKGDEDKRSSLPVAKLPRSREVDFSRPIDAAFTRDYNQVNKPSPKTPVGYQGGFLVVRPSLEVLERYRTILKKAEFLLGPREGWGGKMGGFYGDITFQGIVPYYYEYVAPEGEHNEAELDRCTFNQMADNPRISSYKFPRATPLDAKKMGFRDTKRCRDGREDCSEPDCQRVHPRDSITTHFTFCKKPWDCSEGNAGTVANPTCLGLLKEWYAIRRELEDWWLLPSSDDATRAYYHDDKTITQVRKSREGSLDREQYSGYCDEFGTGGYRRLVQPDEPKS